LIRSCFAKLAKPIGKNGGFRWLACLLKSQSSTERRSAMNTNLNTNPSCNNPRPICEAEALVRIHEQARFNAHHLRNETIHALRGQVAQRFTHLLAGIFAR
jgi:hypothetical protein